MKNKFKSIVLTNSQWQKEYDKLDKAFENYMDETMSKRFVNRSNDEEIIGILRTILNNGTGKAETPYEHILIKLMQLRNTPIKNFSFDQEQVDFHYNLWVEESIELQEIKKS